MLLLVLAACVVLGVVLDRVARIRADGCDLRRSGLVLAHFPVVLVELLHLLAVDSPALDPAVAVLVDAQQRAPQLGAFLWEGFRWIVRFDHLHVLCDLGDVMLVEMNLRSKETMVSDHSQPSNGPVGETYLHVANGREGSSARRNETVLFGLAAVRNAHVVLPAPVGSEPYVANFALIRLFACVAASVGLEGNVRQQFRESPGAPGDGINLP